MTSHYTFCQEGAVIYITSSKEITCQYQIAEIDTSNGELHFHLKADINQAVGIYKTKTELGYWNSEPDTFAISENQLVVFINPFPNVTLSLTSNNSLTNNVPQPIGINGFIYVKSSNGDYIERCVGDTIKGTIKLYISENLEIFAVEIWNDGKVIEYKELGIGESKISTFKG